MKRLFSLTLIFIAFLSPVEALCLEGRLKGFSDLSVDFTNQETRSVSVPLGSQDDLTADTFFALLDEQEVVITEIYPFEILPNRFWSGPLSAEAFGKVEIGTRVVRVTLGPDEQRGIVDEFRARAAALRGAMMRRQRDRLKLSLAELEEEILYLGNVLRKYRRDRIDLQVRLKEERQYVSSRLERINDRLDRARDDLDDLEDDRDDLLEERRKLASRTEPPESRIERLDEKIAILNRELDDLRQDIRVLREERREAREDAERRSILKLSTELENLSLDESRVRIDLDQRQSEKDQILKKLERLEKRD